MDEREPVTRTVEASEAEQQWRRLLDDVARREARVLLAESGVPIAAVVSAADFARLRQLDARRQELFAAIEATQAVFADVPEAELEREIGKAIAAVRAESRAGERQVSSAS